LIAKSIAMKLTAIPASVESSAARGVARRIWSAMSAPTSSITAHSRQAARPSCQARCAAAASDRPASCAANLTGSITRNTYANSDTVLMPYGSAVTSCRPVRADRRCACHA
jgi:hypothetical protein